MRWLASVLVAAAFVAPVSAGAADIRIEMRAAAYAPATVHARVGDTLAVVNGDAVRHQPFVPTTGWGVNVGDVEPGGTASVPLARPGQLELECAYHPGMRTIVVVER
jgi:plastocyanin